MSQQVHATWNSPMPVDSTAKKRSMIWFGLAILLLAVPLAALVDWTILGFGFTLFVTLAWPIGFWAQRRSWLKVLRHKQISDFDTKKDPIGLPATLEVSKGPWFVGGDAGVVSFEDPNRMVFTGSRCSFDLARHDVESSGDGSYVVLDEHSRQTDLAFRIRAVSIPDANEFPSRVDVLTRKQAAFLRSVKKPERPSVLPPREACLPHEVEAIDPFSALGLAMAPAYLLSVTLRWTGIPANTALLVTFITYNASVGVWMYLYWRSRQRAIANIVQTEPSVAPNNASLSQ